MVVCNLHVFCIRAGPNETNPELIVDLDRVLSFPVSFKFLKMVAGRTFKIVKAYLRLDRYACHRRILTSALLGS
jgi:hypothetical protein